MIWGDIGKRGRTSEEERELERESEERPNGREISPIRVMYDSVQ